MVLDPNRDNTQDGDFHQRSGMNEDLFLYNHPGNRFDSEGNFDPEAEEVLSRRRINKYGQIEGDDDHMISLNRALNGNNQDEYGYYGFGDDSINTHNTPQPVDDVSLNFDKGDEANRPLEVDISDSLDGSENDIVYYNKEDLTNFSKNLGLNIVKTRPLPEVGLLGSDSGTPTSKHKKRKLKKESPSQRKLKLVSGIYESEPENSRRARDRAFGYSYNPSFDISNIKERDDDFSGRNKKNIGLLGAGKGGFKNKGKGLDTSNDLGVGKNKNRSNSRGNNDQKDTGARRANSQTHSQYGSQSNIGSRNGHRSHSNYSGSLNSSYGVGHGASKMDNSLPSSFKKRITNRNRGRKLNKQPETNSRFKSLALDSKAMRDRHELARKKARKRIASRVINYSFQLDYESPYAEYLPDRYREWQPKEPKKHENNFVHADISRIEDKLDEVSHIYKKDVPQTANSVNRSRSHNRPSVQPSSKSGSRGPSNAFNFAKSLHPQNRTQSSFLRKKSGTNQKTREKPRGQQPIILDNLSDSSLSDGGKDVLKVYNPHRKPPKPAKKISKNKLSSSKLNSGQGRRQGPHSINVTDLK